MMNRYEALSRKFQNCEPVLGTQMTVVESTLVLEAMDRDNLDFMLFDNEHGVYNNERLTNLLQVCRLMGLPSLVRVPDTEYGYIARAMNMGADGIMLPRVETPEQVKIGVEAMRYHPRGRAGCGGFLRFRRGETIDEYQDSRYLLIQIESPEGMRNLPAMLETYGDEIASVIVGPFDLSIMLGKPGRVVAPEVQAAVREVFEICGKYHTSCGIYCADREKAKIYRDLGAQVLWFSMELDFLTRGYNETFAEMLELV